MKIRSKLLLNALISILSLIVLGTTGYFFTNKVAEVSMAIVEKQAIPIISMNYVEKDISEMLIHLIVHTSVSEPDDMKKTEEKIDELRAQVVGDIEKFQEDTNEQGKDVSNGGSTPVFSSTWMPEFQKEWESFDNTGKKALELSWDYAKEDALQLLIEEGRMAYDSMLAIIHENVENRGQQMAMLGKNAASSRYDAGFWIILFTLVIGSAVFAWGIFIIRSIGKAILHARKTVQEISDGNLSVRWKLETRDEMNDLGKALNIMADSLEKKDSVC